MVAKPWNKSEVRVDKLRNVPSAVYKFLCSL